jgi:hypothetical protein
VESQKFGVLKSFESQKKKPKDFKQGIAVLDAVWVAMRHYPLDDDFYKELPDALKPHFELWDAKKPQRG